MGCGPWIWSKTIGLRIHAPTVYFPLIVDEAMMIEPTETESKETGSLHRSDEADCPGSPGGSQSPLGGAPQYPCPAVRRNQGRPPTRCAVPVAAPISRVSFAKGDRDPDGVSLYEGSYR